MLKMLKGADMETKYTLACKLNNYGHPHHEITTMFVCLFKDFKKETREMVQWIRD